MVEGLYTQLGGEQDSSWVLLIRILLLGFPWKFGFLHLGQIQVLVYRISCVSLHMFYFVWHFAKQGLLLFCVEKQAKKNKEKTAVFRWFNQDTPPNSMSSMVLSPWVRGCECISKSQSKPMISNKIREDVLLSRDP